VQNAQGRAHGGGYAYGGRAANDHFANGFGNFAVIGVGVANFFGGEETLVEHDHAAIGPLDGLRYVHEFDFLKKNSLRCAEMGRSMLRPDKIDVNYPFILAKAEEEDE